MERAWTRLPKRVAVTGASGTVGRHLMALFARHGIESVASSRTAPPDKDGNPEWHGWDLAEWREPDALDATFPDVQAVVHAGAAVRSPGIELGERTLFDVNVRATRAIGNWALARRIPMLFISGATVYEAAGGGPLNEDSGLAWQGAIGGAYGHSKLLAEATLWPLRQEGLSLAILRPSSIYGTGMAPGKLIPTWLSAAARGEAIKIAPPAGDRVDLIHAADVAEAIKLTLERRAWGTFNIASGTTYDLIEIAKACVAAAGRGSIERAGGGDGRAPAVRFALDTARARQALEFRAAIGLEQGLGLMRQQRYVSLEIDRS